MSATTSKHFVFVPGSFHGAWCWYKMHPLLNVNGNTSVAIDLPAHGSDTTPVAEVTLDSYVDAVCRLLEGYDRPVTLIGHSRAGIVISQAAERMPDKIEQLVYLCAFLIPNGEPMIATAMTDVDSVLVANLILNEAEGWHFPKSEAIREAFYHDCADDEAMSWEALLTREPNAPVVTPLQLTEERFGKLEKVYIHTKQDKAISPAVQEMMVKRTHVERTFMLDAGHSPFFSKAEELVDILLGL